MNKECFKLLNQLLLVVPERISVLLLAIVQIVDPVGILHEVGFFVDHLGGRFVRQIALVHRISAVQNEVKHSFVHLALISKKFVVNLAFEILQLGVDSCRIRVGWFYAAAGFIPCRRWDCNSRRSFKIGSPEVPEMNNGFAFCVDPVQDDELS